MTNRTLDDGMKPVTVGSTTRKRHLGVEFVIWNRGGAWFWFLTPPRGKSGIIGATTNQAKATREACWSIESMLQSPKRDAGDDTGLSARENAMREDDEP